MSNISVIQIFTTSDENHKNIILKNSSFLHSLKVEYIVFDNSPTFLILEFIKNINYLKYIRQDFLNFKKTIQESGNLANGTRLIFLQGEDILTDQNVHILEKNRINIFKNNLEELDDRKFENFKYEDIFLYFKKEKTLFEKIKLKYLI